MQKPANQIGTVAQGVHNHIHPQELDDTEEGGASENGTNKDDQDGGHIEGDLELQESSDVVVDVAAPKDGVDDRGDVIVDQDHLSCLLGCGAT